MATSFSERNGKWTFNAKVRQRTGFVSIKPPRLWTSKEEAEKDVGLFVWYSSVRDKNDPAVPYSHGKWFKTMLPNDAWNNIRAFLADRGAKIYASKKRKRGVTLDSYSKKARLATKAQQKSEILAAEILEEDSVTPVPAAVVDDNDNISQSIWDVLIMRKDFTELSEGHQMEVSRSIRSFFQNTFWPTVAPGQSKKQQEAWLRSAFGFVDYEFPKDIEDAFRLAVEKKDQGT